MGGLVVPIKSVRTLKKSNSSVLFFRPSPEWEKYLKETFQDTGLQRSITTTYSQGGKVAKVEIIWKNLTAFNSYLNNSKVKWMFLNPKEEYSKANGIEISDFQIEPV